MNIAIICSALILVSVSRSFIELKKRIVYMKEGATCTKADIILGYIYAAIYALIFLVAGVIMCSQILDILGYHKLKRMLISLATWVIEILW